ncbi:unnamed protein product, partial [Heterobilharzia americana]
MSSKVILDIKGSMRHMLTDLLSPALAIRCTLIGTPNKLALCKCSFHKVVRSILLAEFSRLSIMKHELLHEMNDATKAFFHDLRDRVSKRSSRNQSKKNSGMQYEAGTINSVNFPELTNFIYITFLKKGLSIFFAFSRRIT